MEKDIEYNLLFRIKRVGGGKGSSFASPLEAPLKEAKSQPEFPNKQLPMKRKKKEVEKRNNRGIS